MMTGKLVDVLDYRGCFMKYSDSTVFDYSPEQVFDVVADIEKYPQFLRGWMSVKVLQKLDKRLTVEQQLGFPFMNWKFAAEAVLEPPFHIHIQSFKGPYLDLDIDWSFLPVDNHRTRVTLTINSNSTPGPEHQFLHGILTSASMSILDYFRQRLQQLHSQVTAKIM